MWRFLLVCLIFGSQGSVLAADVVKIGYHQLKPHSFAEEGSFKAVGSAVQVVDELLVAAGYKVEWVGPLPFPRLIEMLKRGSIDGALPLSKSSERELFLFYPDKPLFRINPSFTVLKTNPLKAIKSIEDVKGYRVGFLTGAHQSDFLKNNAASFTIELLPGEQWVTQNLNKLLAGRLDAIYDLNPWSIPYEAKLAGLSDKIKVLRLPEPPGYNYIVISKKSSQAQELLKRLNVIMNKKKFNYQDYIDSISSKN